jgi:hypothetical protein
MGANRPSISALFFESNVIEVRQEDGFENFSRTICANKKDAVFGLPEVGL